jgi:hypothetical protein
VDAERAEGAKARERGVDLADLRGQVMVVSSTRMLRTEHRFPQEAITMITAVVPPFGHEKRQLILRRARERLLRPVIDARDAQREELEGGRCRHLMVFHGKAIWNLG